MQAPVIPGRLRQEDHVCLIENFSLSGKWAASLQDGRKTVMGESTVHSAQKLPSERASARIPGRRVAGSPLRDCLEIWHTCFRSRYSLSSPSKAECSEQAYTSVSIDPSTWFCHPTGRFPYSTGEETEAQRNQITCPRPHGIWQSRAGNLSPVLPVFFLLTPNCLLRVLNRPGDN